MTTRRLGSQHVSVLLLAALLAGCTGGGAPTVAPGLSTPASPPAATHDTAASTASTAPTASEPAIDEPPAAALTAEGGDPVTGQLGTYIWGDGGSDAPWLPGSPTRVGAGELLSVTLEPDVGIAAWRARYVPAASTDPTSATALGSGSGSPSFSAPAGCPWTVEVAIDFAGGRGTASYFWRLDVE
jgi:hypothetical protein